MSRNNYRKRKQIPVGLKTIRNDHRYIMEHYFAQISDNDDMPSTHYLIGIPSSPLI